MLKNQVKLTPVRLKNVRNNQEVICEDITKIRTIDGQDFIEVHTDANARLFWINKATLVKVAKKS